MPIATGQQVQTGVKQWNIDARSQPLIITDDTGKVMFKTVVQVFSPVANPENKFVAFSRPGYVPLRKGEEKDILLGIAELFKQFAEEFKA